MSCTLAGLRWVIVTLSIAVRYLECEPFTACAILPNDPSSMPRVPERASGDDEAIASAELILRADLKRSDSKDPVEAGAVLPERAL